MPPEVAALVTAAEDLGAYRREVCLHQREGICDYWIWPSREEITGGMGESVLSLRKMDSWHVRPSPFYCAMCAVSVQHRVGELAESLKGDPPANAYRAITCKAFGCCHKAYQMWQADLVGLVPQAVMAFAPAHE